MPPDATWTNIFKKNPETFDDYKILSENVIFRELNKRELNRLPQIAHLRSYRSGEVIFQQGEPGVGMYIITKGRIRISQENERGEVEELAVLEKEDFFGEMALLNDLPRSANAVAIEESGLIGIFRPDLFDLIKRNPVMGSKILLQLARVIAERLRQTNEALCKLQDSANMDLKPS